MKALCELLANAILYCSLGLRLLDLGHHPFFLCWEGTALELLLRTPCPQRESLGLRRPFA